MADNTSARPWYVDLTKEIGGLGLVLVMLVGIYVLADRYFGKMEATWDDIHNVTKMDIEQNRVVQENLKQTIIKFMAQQQSRMTEQSARMTEHAERMSNLEHRINELHEIRIDP